MLGIGEKPAAVNRPRLTFTLVPNPFLHLAGKASNTRTSKGARSKLYG